ncbi:MAG: hypothetical protein LVR00_07720 [Rhabdochlamydiaceae bacterium]|jgi:hypothetical protein
MKSKGWIQQRSAQDYLFSVAHPLTLAQKGDLLALIADFPLSQETREKVANRLHKFLFLAAQSSFTFSWKDPAAIIASNEALEKKGKCTSRKCLMQNFSWKSVSMLPIFLSLNLREEFFYRPSQPPF